ncbi:MAG: CDGSH iron-sulfur domain-containing protein [Candidatus Latescibacteria bacterium]|nr:CDGSH iron-sulfur domain-containing protein [Candidatus Latescibacterota bacterium]
MARMIKHTEQGPYLIKEGKFPLAICGCGLSAKKPFCDGTHRKTRDEAEGKVYHYDETGNRTETE